MIIKWRKRKLPLPELPIPKRNSTTLSWKSASLMYQSNTILTNYNIIVLLLQLREWHKVGNNKEQEEVLWADCINKFVPHQHKRT